MKHSCFLWKIHVHFWLSCWFLLKDQQNHLLELGRTGYVTNDASYASWSCRISTNQKKNKYEKLELQFLSPKGWCWEYSKCLARGQQGQTGRVPKMCFECLWRKNWVFSANCPCGLCSSRQTADPHISRCVDSSKFIWNSQTLV